LLRSYTPVRYPVIPRDLELLIQNDCYSQPSFEIMLTREKVTSGLERRSGEAFHTGVDNFLTTKAGIGVSIKDSSARK
jgi:hypothetical protein